MTLVRRAGIRDVGRARRRLRPRTAATNHARGCAGWCSTACEHVDEGDLRRHLVTEETERFVWSSKKPFDPFSLRLDTATVESYYRARGFFDARVTSTDVTPADRAHAVNVEIFVDEGAATKIEKRQGRGARRHRRRRQDDLPQPRLAARADLRLRALRGGEGRDARSGCARSATPGREVDGDVVVDRDHHVADVDAQDRARAARRRVRNVEVEGAYSVDRKLIIKPLAVAARGARDPRGDRDGARQAVQPRLSVVGAHRLQHNRLHPEQADVTLSLVEGPAQRVALRRRPHARAAAHRGARARRVHALPLARRSAPAARCAPSRPTCSCRRSGTRCARGRPAPSRWR